MGQIVWWTSEPFQRRERSERCRDSRVLSRQASDGPACKCGRHSPGEAGLPPEQIHHLTWTMVHAPITCGKLWAYLAEASDHLPASRQGEAEEEGVSLESEEVQEARQEETMSQSVCQMAHQDGYRSAQTAYGEVLVPLAANRCQPPGLAEDAGGETYQPPLEPRA